MIHSIAPISHFVMQIIESAGRINDDRMIKVRLKDPSNIYSIETSHYSVGDRESLLGFPKGFVERKGK